VDRVPSAGVMVFQLEIHINASLPMPRPARAVEELLLPGCPALTNHSGFAESSGAEKRQFAERVLVRKEPLNREPSPPGQVNASIPRVWRKRAAIPHSPSR